MRQISNKTHATLLRHLPVVAGEGLRSGDRRTCNSARLLMLAYRAMSRAERRQKANELWQE